MKSNIASGKNKILPMNALVTWYSLTLRKTLMQKNLNVTHSDVSFVFSF